MSAVRDNIEHLAQLYGDREVTQLRVPPMSVESEQSVLGGLMLAPEAIAKVGDWLKTEDFYRRDHQLIYRAICELAGKNKPYDAVTLGDWFESQGLAEQVAGGAYLIELASTTPSAANIVAYAEIVRDKSILRQGIEIGTDLVNSCFQPEGRDSLEILGGATHALTALKGNPRVGGLTPLKDGLNDWFEDLRARYQRGDAVTGLPYPWADVNKVTHGLQPGEVTIIAGRPSMGKSIMGLNLALFAASRKVNVGFFSLEMTKRQVNRRCISSLMSVPHDWLLAPNDDTDHWPQVTEAVRRLKEVPLLVDDSSGLSAVQVEARVRRAHMQRPIELLVIDHLHEMEIPGKQDPRFEYEAIVAMGKKLAKEFNCPAVLLAQLNRGVESRADKRPVMADLRETGALEQKADVIWFLYREDYYQRNAPGWVPRRDVELILAKGRDLEVGAPIILREDYKHMALRDWEWEKHGDKPQRFVAKRQSSGLE